MRDLGLKENWSAWPPQRQIVWSIECLAGSRPGAGPTCPGNSRNTSRGPQLNAALFPRRGFKLAINGSPLKANRIRLRRTECHLAG